MRIVLNLMMMSLIFISCAKPNQVVQVVADLPEQGPVSKLTELPLADYIDRAISAADPAIGVTERKQLSSMLVSIADATFTSKEHKIYWIALIGVESGFNQRAKSSAGAVGLGQLMVRYYVGIAKQCGLGELAADTITDRYINAGVSACYFKYLINQSDNSVSLALVAYNAGINSSSYKHASKGGVPVTETAGYVSKVNISKEQLSK